MSEAKIEVGTAIPATPTQVTRALIDQFGEIANDFNPVHFDDEFARGRGFAGAIAHGAVSASLLFEMMVHWLPDWPLAGDNMEIAFVAPVLVGDSVTAKGVVESIGDGKAVCEVWCEKAAGKKVIAGKAHVVLAREARQ
jgi:3-hydroxybutyryl-CoA dehydratase